MSSVIKSQVNPKIKRLVRLRDKRSRKREDAFLVEGRPEIDRFLETQQQIEEVYYCPKLMEDKQFLECFPKDVPQFEVDESVFAKFAYGHRMEGVVVVAKTPEHTLADVPLKKNPLYVVIEQVEKPGNLGAILRSCDGSGVDAIFLCDARVDLYNPNVIRASLGTIFSQCIVAESKEKIFDFLKEQNVQMCAATPDAKANYTEINWKQPLALVVGTESEGLTPFWLEKADQNIRIPMLGKADSLNVSVSTAIILYEMVRQRHG